MNETRVLLVEDEPGYARFLREVLNEPAGTVTELTCVESLEDAIEKLASDSFDIVLLDLGLPDADGLEAVVRVTASCPDTPIVVLSSLSDVDVALESMRVGAQEYLVKGQSEHLLLPRAIRYALERKRLQDIVVSARLEAERANAVKDEFLAMLGHELRNPLAPIVTALELMRQQGVMDRERAVVERQVQHVVRLVDDLLDVARIARGKIALHRTEVDLAEVVADGLETAKPLFESQRHALAVDVPTNRFFVDGDRSRLAQVAANLLTNAAKYTQSGGTISISAQSSSDVVELSVRDDGVGMAPDLLVRVFDLFEQGSRTIDRSLGGLGLGLAIVKSIVTLHDGSVSAVSDGPGKGSTFIVRLPLMTPQPTKSTPRIDTPQPIDQPARRILIVDDNVDSAEMLEMALQAMGHTTRIANDGPRALQIAEELRPDIALLDIGLPLMDGYEVARRLRALLGDDAPVLFAITGYGQPSDRLRAKEAGFDVHLVKPVDVRRLHDLVLRPRADLRLSLK